MSTPAETRPAHTRVDALEKVTGQAKYVERRRALGRRIVASVFGESVQLLFKPVMFFSGVGSMVFG